MKVRSFLSTVFVSTALLSCTADPSFNAAIEESMPVMDSSVKAPYTKVEGELVAVTGVEVTGSSGAYTFTVTIASPDTGCDQYANWWEVVTPDGELLYRRILAHSHPNEQPFTRSGGPIAVNADQPVIVRVHMNNSGYSNLIAQGVPGKAILSTTLTTPDFALALADAAPQPTECAF